MDWPVISGWHVFALAVGLIALYGVALVQIVGAPRLGLIERLAWIAGVLFVPYLGAAAWFVYGRPRATRLHTQVYPGRR